MKGKEVVKMNLETLREAKKKAGLTIAQIAQRANLPKGTVQNIFCGYVPNPRSDTLEAIERALGLSDEGYRDTLPFEVTPMEEELVQTFRTLSEEDKQLLFILMKKIK